MFACNSHFRKFSFHLLARLQIPILYQIPEQEPFRSLLTHAPFEKAAFVAAYT